MKLAKKISIAALLLLSSQVFAQSSSEFYEKALASFEDKDFETAYIHLKNSLKENEDNLPAKILMGKVLLISGYMYESEEILEEALAMGADPSLVVDTLGKVWLYTKQNEKIIDSQFNNLSAKSLNEWQIIVATAQLNLKNVEAARQGYELALKNDPANIRVLNALSSLEMRDEKYDKASSYLELSIALEPDNAQTLRIKGDLYLFQQKLDEAIKYYQQSYALEPEDPIIKRSLVSAYLKNQDIDSAKQLLDEILEQTPGDPTGMLLKAWLLAKNQLSDDAARELEKLSAQLAGLSEESLQDDPSLFYVSALSAYALQNYIQAKTFFIQYLNFVPDNLEAVALLAKTHLKLNESKLALEVMQRHERHLIEKLDNALLLAELYLANDKAFKAVEISGKLKKQYPDNPNVELLEIKTLQSRGKVEDALAQLEQSKHAKTNLRFVILRSELLMNLNRLAEADEIADQLLEAVPENIDFLNLKAGIQIRLGKPTEAEEYLDKALAINPDHFSAQYNKANLLSSRGKHQEALEIVEKLNTIQPDNIRVLTLLARCQFNASMLEDAEKNLQRVLQKDINNLAALELLATIYTQQGELERAVRQLNIAIKTEPDAAVYQMRRVELYIALKQTDRAAREIKKIYNLVQDNAIGLVELSKLQYKAGLIEDAKQSIVEAYQIHPDSLFLATEYISLHLATNDLNSASEMVEKWLKTHPQESRLLILSGDLNIAKNALENAFDNYFSALQINNLNRNAMFKLYQLASRGINNNKFETFVTDFLEQNPEQHFQRSIYADYLLNLNRFDEATPHYRKLVTVENIPNKAFMLNNLANIYVAKDLAKAEQYVEQALAIESENSAIYDTQGWIKTLQGKYNEALTILRKSFAMDSNSPSNQYHLAVTLQKLGRTAEAKTSVQRALNANQDFMEKKQAEELLNQL
ncbi:PEP-CTERM system TPR-repeat protein PrsT [Aliiglaciecola sp. 3_MG-2023]|uniref:XrtA/PEP-CTERM system TPR-repeat protein PrsT n=1 Tax=Aliiglaciecola sp. 3_MG-2023 TaxID=3062644 RepID=UPI0026E219E1|nr:XrtA/PEP-CTERM system TPR-repeat protein PrsT [Aliiglaciecola sp. 3_MG-2023]MDO6693940.1 PEP-CTERM system TPR-repeat protein PrsT [Aliiglaciecola sp. 3_MG-2023]